MVFEAFLDWAEEHGLPFKQWADALEEKGIPGWLPFLAVVVVVGALAFFFIQAPESKGTVVVYTKTVDGQPLNDVNVSLFVSGFQKSIVSGESGMVRFEGVPAGNVQVFPSASVVLDPPSLEFSLKPGEQVQKTVYSTLTVSETVLLQADVVGPPSAQITLFDSEGKEIDFIKDVLTYAFRVLPKKKYRVKAEADGFLSDEKEIAVGESNAHVELILQKKGEATQAQLHVKVFKDVGGEQPLENASVTVQEANRIVAQALSAEDGSIAPVTVGLGSTLIINARKDGFLEKSVEVNVSSLEERVVVLLAVSAVPKEGFLIQVRDNLGNRVSSPIVRLYKGATLKGESLPSDGIASFDVEPSGLSATIYKSGYLPVFLEPLKKDNLVILQPALQNNSAAVKVIVRDFKGRDLVGATVELLDANRKPIGIPPRVTGLDGTQQFDDVPLSLMLVRATHEGRTKESDRFRLEREENEFNATLVEIQFDPQTIKFTAKVLDRFSRQALSGAKVSIGEASCTTSVKGECTFGVVETDSAVAKVSSAGYEDFESAPFAVSPLERERSFELFSTSVAAALRLNFVGVFDTAGNKVNALAPLTEYEARYVLRAPNVSFTKAEALVDVNGANLLGGQSVGARVTKGTGVESTQAESLETIQITSEGFFPASFEVPVGSSVPFNNADNRTHALTFDDGQTLLLQPNDKKNLVFNKAGSIGFRSLGSSFSGFATVTERPRASEEEAKTILFEFPKFSGTKELTVRFKTRREEVVLKHRTAFFTDVEVLRDPPDGLKESGKFAVEFQGECSEQICVQFYFQRDKQKIKKLDLPLNENAQLVVRVTGLEQTGLLRVVPSEAVSVLSGKNEVASATTGNESFLRLPKGVSESIFTIKGKRLSDDASVRLSVLVKNESLFDAEAFLRVFSKTKPALVVKLKPTRVPALTSSKLTFLVTDSLFDEPITDARVKVGTQEANSEKPGEYSLEVQPESLEPLRFEVVKTGFKTFRGSISIEPPDELLTVEPKLLTLSVDSKDKTSSPVQLTNKLSDSVSVSLSFSLDGQADITDIKLNTNSLRLKGKQTTPFELSAAIKQDVLAVARKAGTLKEGVKGTIRLTANARSFTSDQSIRFAVQSTFAQQSIDDVWQMSADSLSFRLEPPKKKEEKQEITVSNQGPHPLVFNVEQTLGLSIQPASLVLNSGDQGTFAVKAFAREVDCFSEDLQKQGAVTVHASFQGISSKKTAQVTLEISTSNLVCVPQPGFRVTLPVDIRMLLLPNSRTKTNPDGSTSVLFPTRELIAFDTGASVTPVEANVPHTTRIVFETYRVRPIQGGWMISFPTPTILALPADAEREVLPSGETQITLENAQIVLPTGTQVTVPHAGQRVQQNNEALVPASVPVIFRVIPFNYNALANVLPPDSLEITLPVDAVFDLPSGTTEKTPKRFTSSLSPRVAQENLQNVKAVQLPSGERLAFSQDAAISLEQQIVRLPAGASLYVSRNRVRQVEGLELSQGFELKMPVSYALIYALDSKVFKTQAGLYALRLSEEASVEASWKLSPTKKSIGFELRVVRETPLIYRKGAAARQPVDPASLASCRLSYTSNEELVFSLPEGTTLEKAEGGFLATLRRCDETSKIRFSVNMPSLGSKEVLETPAIKQLYFPSNAEFLVGDAQTTSEKSVRVKGKVQFVSCLKDEQGKEVPETLQALRVTFPEPSFVAFPPRVILPKDPPDEIDLKQLAAVRIQSKNTPLQDLGSTKKIFLDKNNQDIKPTGPPDYTHYGLLFPEGSGLHYVPSCEKAKRKLDAKVTAEDFEVVTDKESKGKVLNVTFSNKDFKSPPVESREVCILNKGSDVIIVDGVKSEADAGESLDRRLKIQQIMDASPESAYFKQTDVYGNKQRLPIDFTPKRQEPPCHTFVVNFKLPPEALMTEQCIRSDWDTTSKGPLKGSYVFSLKDSNNEPIATSPQHRISAEVTIDAKTEDCQQFRQEKQVQDLVELSVNYDKEELGAVRKDVNLADWSIDDLVFKALNHQRYFAITNNEERTLKLEKIDGDGVSLMRCQRVDTSVVLAPGAEIPAGSVLLLSCTSLREGKGIYNLHFSGALFQKLKQVSVQVFKPDPAVSAFYATSPVGKVLPFFTEKSPKATQAPYSPISLASSQSSLSFAENNTVEVTPKEQTPSSSISRQQRVELLQEVKDFRFCKTYFCTELQAEKAINSFMKSFSVLANARLSGREGKPTMESIRAFCDKLDVQGGAKKLQKALFLQLTNVELSSDQMRGLAQSMKNTWAGQPEYFGEYGEVTLNTAGSSVFFDGCGFYELKVTLNPMCGMGSYATPEEWKKAMKIEVTTPYRMARCPENLANAGLFLATSSQELAAYSGNRLGKGVVAAVKDGFTGVLKAPAVVTSLFSKPDNKTVLEHSLVTLGRLREGVLGTYAPEVHPKDEETVQATYSALFGVNQKKSSVKMCPSAGEGGLAFKPCPAVPYDDAGFCGKTGGKVLIGLVGANILTGILQTTAAVSQASVGLPSGWVMTVKAIVSNYRFISGTAACATSGIVTKNMCGLLEGCASAALATLTESLIPWPGALKLLPGEIEALRSTNQLAFGISVSGSIAAQTGLGVGTVALAEYLAGPTTQNVPTVPIVFIIRHAPVLPVNPEKFERFGFAVKRLSYAIPVTLEGRRTHERWRIENELWKNGVSRSQASEAAKILTDLTDDKLAIRGGLDRPLFQAMSTLDDAAVQKIAEEGDPLSHLARNVQKKNPEVVYEYLRNNILEDPLTRRSPLDNAENVKTLLSEMGEARRNALLKEIDARAILRTSINNPEAVKNLFRELDEPAQVKLLRAMEGKFSVKKAFEQLRTADPKATDLEIAEALADNSNFKRALAGSVDTLSDLQIAKGLANDVSFKSALHAALSDPAKGHLDEFVTRNIKFTDAAGKTRRVGFKAALEEDMLRLFDIRTGQPGLIRDDFKRLAQLRGIRTLDDEPVRLRGFAQGSSETSVNLRDVATKELRELSEARQKGAIKLSRSLELGRFIRGFGGIIATLFFSTDFRPVQTQTFPGLRSHVIAFHAEDGVPSTRGICVGKAADECKVNAPQLLKAEKLCDRSVCVKWFKWPSTSFTSYAVLAAFNDKVPVDPQLLYSIFVPETAPITPDKPYVNNADIQSELLKLEGLGLQAETFDAKSLKINRAQILLDAARNLRPVARQPDVVDQQISKLQEALRLYQQGKVSQADALVEAADKALKEATVTP